VSAILKVEGLTKWFGYTKAIENLSFEVNKGQVVGILGPNGSGKSTTLSIILGVKHQTQGTYSWSNLVGNGNVNKNIGALLEMPYFYPYLSLDKNLQITALIKGAPMLQIDEVLQTVGLLNRKSSKYYTLSMGMKQRLALASALLGNPQVLILDEPTNGLDPEGIAEVRDIIVLLSKQGKTIILASHILDEVEKVCSHVIILKEGRIITQGEVKELLTDKLMVSITAEDLQILLTALRSISEIEIVNELSDSIVVTIDEKTSIANINSRLVGMGIAPTSIHVHKKTLESQFLDLINK
jgi:ABC-2 type transport system ATP-binding protein